MAAAPSSTKSSTFLVPSKESQSLILNYVKSVLLAHKKFTDFPNKMEQIDIAYARYKETQSEEDACVPCGNVFAEDDVVAPIVVSQVDSMVAYLADVFVGGYPLFPVVSTPSKRVWAEQLETLIDDHAGIAGYARQILLFLRDAVKYNFGPLEMEWDEVPQYQISSDYTALIGGQKLTKDKKYLTKLRRRDPYNTLWDYNVAPGDVALEGDYAGYIERLTKTKLKRYLNCLSENKESFNVSAALDSSVGEDNYRIHPQISNYISARKPKNEVDWEWYMKGATSSPTTPSGASLGDYEKVVVYARILPSEFKMSSVPQPNTPQIWRFVVINSAVVVEARRVITPFDSLPIVFGQPLEDGLGYQTQSLAESEIPIQEAASTLYNIRFSAARRAVSDRAIYDSSAISEEDINSRAAAPKIPVKPNILNQKGLDAYYKQIPFDMRGTETTISDAAQLVEFSKQLSGLNNARQGQFQKGNKSVQEWNDIMGSADTRLRLPAIILEHQVFYLIKATLVFNIFQKGQDAVVVSQKTGEEYDIKIDELRKQVLAFRLADGYSPKAKMASTEVLTQGLTLLMNSPVLQAQYGNSITSLFAHLMQLGGVRGLEEYSPDYQKKLGVPAGNPLAAQTLQEQTVAPEAVPQGVPMIPQQGV